MWPWPSTRSCSRRSPLTGPASPTTRRRALLLAGNSWRLDFPRGDGLLCWDNASRARFPLDQVNIAMAVALDGGLITPVLTDVANTDIFQLGRTWKARF